jgi:hypothetical protein
MRPKLVWRLACPALVILLAAAADLSDWRRLLVSSGFVAASLLPFRSFIRIQNRVVYQRGPFRWYRPLDLDQVHDVKLTRWDSKFPHRRLDFGSVDDRRSIALCWWSNWRPLVTMIARSASAPRVDEPAHQEWKLKLDPTTERYLSGFL